MKTPFIWLGSGRTKKRDVATKGLLLDLAAKRGLPVPSGAILLAEFCQLLLAEGVVVNENGRFSTTDPQWLHETLYQGVRFPHFNNLVAVRTAAAAGVEPQLGVTFDDANQLSSSLCEIWSQMADQQRDILVMEMVDCRESGTAVTRPDSAQDTIRFHDQPPVSLTQLRPWQRPDSAEPAHLQRLQMLLRGVRRSLGKKAWQIDWMDDGRICWLLQIQQV
jgi:hypothetical protein